MMATKAHVERKARSADSLVREFQNFHTDLRTERSALILR